MSRKVCFPPLVCLTPYISPTPCMFHSVCISHSVYFPLHHSVCVHSIFVSLRVCLLLRENVPLQIYVPLRVCDPLCLYLTSCLSHSCVSYSVHFQLCLYFIPYPTPFSLRVHPTLCVFPFSLEPPFYCMYTVFKIRSGPDSRQITV